MRAIVIREAGGPEVLELREVSPPEVPYGHVRVRVRAAGVNRADLLQRMGMYPAPPGVPADIPGLEYAGEVETVGPGVRDLSVGQRVMGLVAGGAYAELVVVHEREVARAPMQLDDVNAAAVPEAFVTAYDALVAQGNLRPGERVLIHAVGSGVGTAGLQIARALGCDVVGTSRTLDKIERCRALGMTHGVLPENGKFADAVKRDTHGQGVDVVLDLVGGSYFPETVASCAPRARILLVGLTAGAFAEVPLGLLLRQRLTVIGTALRSRPLEEKIAAAKLLSGPLSSFLREGRIKPIVDRVFPLADAALAHAYVASNESFGKVMLAL
jgi:NADPH:quinone reductase